MTKIVQKSCPTDPLLNRSGSVLISYPSSSVSMDVNLSPNEEVIEAEAWFADQDKLYFLKRSRIIAGLFAKKNYTRVG